MKQYTISTYSLDELCGAARGRALEHLQQESYAQGYHWAQESLESLKAFLERFNAVLHGYRIEWDYPSRSSIHFTVEEPTTIEEIDSVHRVIEEAGSYDPITLSGYGDCLLTGFCMDEPLLDGFRTHWAVYTGDLRGALQAGIDELLRECAADYQYALSEPAMLEAAELFEWQFSEQGHPFYGFD